LLYPAFTPDPISSLPSSTTATISTVANIANTANVNTATKANKLPHLPRRPPTINELTPTRPCPTRCKHFYVVRFSFCCPRSHVLFLCFFSKLEYCIAPHELRSDTVPSCWSATPIASLDAINGHACSERQSYALHADVILEFRSLVHTVRRNIGCHQRSCKVLDTRSKRRCKHTLTVLEVVREPSSSQLA
jgi:hypothetical protein